MEEVELLEGLKLLLQAGLKGKTHQDYAKVVELARKYKAFITGENIEAYLIQFVQRETKEAFQQRADLTQSITPASAEKVMTGFRKLTKLDNILKKIEWQDLKDKEVKDRLKELNETLNKFYGDETLDEYLEERFIDLSFYDPNAFIVIEFDEYDEVKTKPQPRPFEVTSDKAVDYFFDNNILRFLTVKTPHQYQKDGETVNANKYTIYLNDQALTLTPIDPAKYNEIQDSTEDEVMENFDRYLPADLNEIKVIRLNNEKAFEVELFEYKTKKIPAYRIGYKRDMTTNGRTMVSPIHPAMPYMMKSLKTVSEFDLTMCLHAFPQKMQYVKKCPGAETLGCRNGIDVNGSECSVCNGDGYLLQKSAQDAILLPMPKKQDDMVDLEKMLVYKSPSIDLLKFQSEETDKLEKKIVSAVFNSDTFYQNETVKTATELVISSDNLYDTLNPYAKKFSKVYQFITRISATLIEFGEGIKVVHKFPTDLKLKTVYTLLKEYEAAVNSQAPEFVKVEMADDLANKIFSDDKQARLRYQVKMKFMPFKGKNETEKIAMLNSNLVRQREKILYSNFGTIFSELETENEEFYMLSTEKQTQLIDEKIKKIAEEAEPNLASNSVPAGVLDDLLEKIESGEMEKAAALKTLTETYSISVEEATEKLNG